MKFKKKILFATISTIASAIVASSAIVATVASSSNIKRNVVQSSKITFDGKTFNSVAERDAYIQNNIELKNVDTVTSDRYYIEYEDGTRKYLSSDEITNFTKYLTNNTNISDEKQLHTSLDELKENSQYEFGIVDPTWYKTYSTMTPVENPDQSSGEGFYVYRGNGGIGHVSETKAAESFLNSNNEVYYFNDIYFRSTEDLREYLESIYFKDPINKKQTFRIKGPNGDLSELIDTSNENWQEVATNFILDNASKLLKITDNKGNVKFLDMNNLEELKKAIDVNDIPYVAVNSNNGNMNWVTGLRRDDEFKLSGPVYYSGYDNLTSMSNPDLWHFVSNKESEALTSNPIEYMFVAPTNTWFSKYFNESVSIDKETNDITLGTNYLLFAETNTKRVRNITAELLDNNNKTVVDKITLGNIESLNNQDLEVELAKVDGSALVNDYVKNMSEQLYAYFLAGRYYSVYEEVLSSAKQFAASESYSFILKIPLLYYIFMDRLMTMGADQDTVNYVREYFYKLTSIVEELLDKSFGKSVFTPNETKSGYGELDLHDLFDISLDGSQKIDFNLQEIANIIDSVYPNLAIACSVNQTVSLFDKFGEEINSNQFRNLIHMNTSLFYSNESSAFTNNCINTLLVNENDINNINNSETMFTETRIKEAFSDDIKLATWTMMATEYDDTTTRDDILEIISDEVNELISANDSWSFVSNDNRFKMYEYYQRKYNNQENKKPSDYLTTVSAFDYRSLLYWNIVFNEWHDEISSSDKYSEIAQIYERYFKTKAHNDLTDYEKFVEEETINSNQVYQKWMEEDDSNSISMNLFGGIVQNFASFASITLMRMLADIATDESLFIIDSKINAKVINPEFKTAATKLVFDLVFKQDKTEQEIKLFESLSWLYRGFQSIQQSIDTVIVANETSNESEKNILDVENIKAILKNTAQYSSIINSNMSMFKSMLAQLNIKAKTGQIIAYSGSIDYIQNSDSQAAYEPNITRTNELNYSKNEFNDLVSIIPNVYVSENSNQKLDTYVMPNYSIENGVFNQELYIANTVYAIPKYAHDFESLDMTEYSFDKYFDTSLLEGYGFDKNLYSTSKDGYWLYYNANEIFDSETNAYKYANNVSINLVKKWGYWFTKTEGINYNSSSLSSNGVTMSTRSGTINNSSYSDQFSPKQNITLSSKTLQFSHNNITNVLNNNSFVSDDNGLNYKLKKSSYGDCGIDMIGNTQTRVKTGVSPIFKNYYGNEVRTSFIDSTKLKWAARTKYYSLMAPSSNKSTLSAVNMGLQSKLIVYVATAEHSRAKTVATDLISSSAKNSSNGLTPSKSLINNPNDYQQSFKNELNKKQMKAISSISYSKSSRTLIGLDYNDLVKVLTNSGDWDQNSSYFNSHTKKVNLAYYESYKKRYNLPDDPYLKHIAETGKVDNSLINQSQREIWNKNLVQEKNALKNSINDDFVKQMNKYADNGYKPFDAANKYISNMESHNRQHGNVIKGDRLHRFYQKNIEGYRTTLRNVTVDGTKHRASRYDLNGATYENRFVNRLETAKAHDVYYKSFKQASLNTDLVVKDPKAFVKIASNIQGEVMTRELDALDKATMNKNNPDKYEFYKNESKYYRSLGEQIKNDKAIVKSSELYNASSKVGDKNSQYSAKAAAKLKSDLYNGNTAKLDKISSKVSTASDEFLVESLKKTQKNVKNRTTNTQVSKAKAISAQINPTNPNTMQRNTVNGAKNSGTQYDPVRGSQNVSNNAINDGIAVATQVNESTPWFSRFLNSKGMQIFNAVSSVLGIAGLIVSVVQLGLMLNAWFNPPIETYSSSYVYQTDYAQWSWNGGQWTYRGGAYKETNYTRTARDMKLIKPIKINSVYEDDFKYFNGKMYKNDNELKEAFINWIVEQEHEYSNNEDLAGKEIKLTDNLSIVYTFDDINQRKTPTTYISKQELANAIVNSIKLGDKKYTTNNIYSLTDGYNGSWSSTNDDAAIANAAEAIINEIRPSYVSVLPELYVDELGTKTNYAGSMGKFDMLPGNSWDSETKKVITAELKEAQNQEFRSNKYLVDHSANLKHNDNKNNFVEPNKEIAAKKSREKLTAKSIDTIKKMLEKQEVSYAIFNPNTSFDEIVKNNKNVMTFNVVSYYDPDTKNTLIFSDTYKKDGTKIEARENFNKYLKYKYNLKREEVITQQTYIVYNGQYYSSMADLIKYNS